MPRLALAVAIVFSIPLLGCGRRGDDGTAQPQRADNGTLIIFHAGSLAVPFKQLAEAFENDHPGVTVLSEAAGSRDTARKVSDLDRSCDVLGSADYKVVENLLMPEHASFNIRFATNEMAIAYTATSAGSDRITKQNWHEILLSENVIFGRADPNSDPCGYRTVMLFQLAETYYDVEGLADRLEAAHGKRYIRPKETDLLALLEAGEVDYLPIYRSVAVQHGLRFIQLPDEMNLKNADLADLYATATIQVTGKRPGEFITRAGAPINYSVTIPGNARNPDLGERFIEFLLSSRGRTIMAGSGQEPIHPAVCAEFQFLPESLKPYCNEP